MSDGEVKRWWLRSKYDRNSTWYASTIKEYHEGYSSCVEVMPVEDHDRIVADLNHKLAIKSRGYTREEYMEEIFRYEKTIASQKRVIEMLKIIDRIVDELKAQVSEQAQTIASQKRVIEMLKEQRNAWKIYTDGYKDEMSVEEMDAELAAIEKGEA